MEMDRGKLEGQLATLNGLRDTVGGMTYEATPENIERLAGGFEAVAGVLAKMIEDAIAFHAKLAALAAQQPAISDHAKAVEELARSHKADTNDGRFVPCGHRIGSTTCGYGPNAAMHEGSEEPEPPMGRHKYRPQVDADARD
jgi:hypothetical protein